MHIHYCSVNTRLQSPGLQAEAEPGEFLITLLSAPPGTSMNSEFNVVWVTMCSRPWLLRLSALTPHRFHVISIMVTSDVNLGLYSKCSQTKASQKPDKHILWNTCTQGLIDNISEWKWSRHHESLKHTVQSDTEYTACCWLVEVMLSFWIINMLGLTPKLQKSVFLPPCVSRQQAALWITQLLQTVSNWGKKTQMKTGW